MTSVRETLRFIPRFATMMRIGLSAAIAFRAELLLWVLTNTLPLVMMALWLTAAESGPIGRFTGPAFVTYYLVGLVVRQLGATWVVWQIDMEVRTGTLSLRLLRPVHPMWTYAAENLGALPLRPVALAPVIMLAVLLLPTEPLVLTPIRVAAFVASTFAGWMLVFLAQNIIGLCALWVERATAIWEAWFGLFALLSGYLIPVSLMPGWMQSVAIWSPFYAMSGLPTEIVMGIVSGDALTFGLARSLGWVLISLVLANLMWRRSVRHFGAFGG
jgi:ABC-2 type transport system permease protein